MTSSQLSRDIAVYAGCEVAPDPYPFDQSLVRRTTHRASSAGRESVRKLGLHCHNLQAAVGAPEPEKKVHERAVAKPVWRVNAGELERRRVEADKVSPPEKLP